MGRHTLTLDEDNDRLLRDEQQRAGKPFKAVVNDLLREAHQRRRSETQRKRAKRYALEPLSVGRVRHPVVNIPEALEFAEGDDFQ